MNTRAKQTSGRKPSPRRSPIERAEFFGIAWFTVLFVLAIGVRNGTTNQNNYLLKGLRMADPGFLPGDWFTGEVAHSHEVFSMLVAGLARMDFLVSGLALGAVIQNALFALALYYLLRAVYHQPMAPWAASLALFAGFGTANLGSIRWLKPYLEASSLSGVAVAFGIAFLVRRRYFVTGLALGLAGLLHEHFIVLCLPVMAVATFMTFAPRAATTRWKNLGLLWGSFLVLSLPSLLTIIRYSTAPGVEEIHWLTAALFPYHVDPWTWSSYYYLILAASLLMGTGGILLRKPDGNREVALVLGAITGTVLVSLILAYSGIGLATQVWPWRLSPLIFLAGLVAGMAALSAPDLLRPARPGQERLAFGLLLIGIAILAQMTFTPTVHALWALCALPVASWAADAFPSRLRRFRPSRELLVGVVITIAFAPVIVKGLRYSHIEFRPSSPDRVALYEWARTDTPEDAVFAAPPGWEDFRLNARRPLVVDWKSIPRYAPDRIEWLERIRALTGIHRPVPEPGSAPSIGGSYLDPAYANMDCDRAQMLRMRFGTRFIIHERPKQLDCGRLVYEDEQFRAWDLGDPVGSSTP